MSFTPPPNEPRTKVDAAKARAEQRRIAALGHAEVHRALGRDMGPNKPRRIWLRLRGVLSGTRYAE